MTLVQSRKRGAKQGSLLLGRYRLDERLGSGGFATVWSAYDEQLGRPVALKRIPLPSEEDRERAGREALATARLGHPSIVALYEASADDDAFYLISELVEGDTLAQLIEADRLSDEQIFEIALALVAALRHAHERGVIHRDVKPQNVLVPSSALEQDSAPGKSAPLAKLADFGGARMAGDDALTRTGNVFGTLAYMAPEQSEGLEVGPSADLYSLALVVYETLAGVNPVRGPTPAATAKRIGAPIVSLRHYRRDLPRELTETLDAALDPDPDRRGTLVDLQAALEGTLEVRLAGTLAQEPRPRLLAQRPRPSLPGFPRFVWLGSLLAIAAWLALRGLAGASLLVLAAGAPLLVLPRRSGPGWLAAALAPLLGIIGLAGAFPALAGQRADWRARGALAALGFWWLALSEPLFDRRLWLGPPHGLAARHVWEASFSKTATQVIGGALTVELLLGAAVWAIASVILAWMVRGRSASLDLGAAFAWTVALLGAMPLLENLLSVHLERSSPRGALLGALAGCAIAVCARALRGPASRYSRS